MHRSRFALYLSIIGLIGGCLWLNQAQAQSGNIPDYPDSDETLYDPDSADFNDDIFFDSFDSSVETTTPNTVDSAVSDDSLDLVADSTEADTTSATTAATTTPAATVTTTTVVEDTATGPETGMVFWTSFVGSFVLLVFLREYFKKRDDYSY